MLLVQDTTMFEESESQSGGQGRGLLPQGEQQVLAFQLCCILWSFFLCTTFCCCLLLFRRSHRIHLVQLIARPRQRCFVLVQ